MKGLYETPEIEIVVFDLEDKTNAVATTSANLNNYNKIFKYTEIEEIK